MCVHRTSRLNRQITKVSERYWKTLEALVINYVFFLVLLIVCFMSDFLACDMLGNKYCDRSVVSVTSCPYDRPTNNGPTKPRGSWGSYFTFNNNTRIYHCTSVQYRLADVGWTISLTRHLSLCMFVGHGLLAIPCSYITKLYHQSLSCTIKYRVSLNIVFFSKDFRIFWTLVVLCFPLVSVCVHTPGR